MPTAKKSPKANRGAYEKTADAPKPTHSKIRRGRRPPLGRLPGFPQREHRRQRGTRQQGQRNLPRHPQRPCATKLSNLYDFRSRRNIPWPTTNSPDYDPKAYRILRRDFPNSETEVIAAYDKYEFHVVYQKLSQFISVELSSIYHDVIKDRMYTDAANSPRRRSTQTALHKLVAGLCQMLAPILAYTADEAWEFVPGKPTGSVHEAKWNPQNFLLTPAGNGNQRVEEVCIPAPRSLPARAGKSPAEPSSLANPWNPKAREIVNGDGQVLVDAQLHLDSLRELLNVSQVSLAKTGSETIFATVTKADGQKCERCWHWETDIGQNPEHPTICGRCVEAVKRSSGNWLEISRLKTRS